VRNLHAGKTDLLSLLRASSYGSFLVLYDCTERYHGFERFYLP